VIGRKLFGVFAVLVLAGFMNAATADAKACPALCRPQIRACMKTCTTKPKGPCKRECKSHFITECKNSSTTPKERTCPASPSAAFLD
jgi:hypothetical protein